MQRAALALLLGQAAALRGGPALRRPTSMNVVRAAPPIYAVLTEPGTSTVPAVNDIAERENLPGVRGRQGRTGGKAGRTGGAGTN